MKKKENDSDVNVEEYLENWLDKFIERLVYKKALDKAIGVAIVGAFDDPIIEQNTPDLTPLEFIQSWAEMFNTPELKPCPFCGGSPVFSENKENETLPQSWCILCLDRKCPLDTMTLDYPSKQEAAKAWNTRGNNE